MKWSCKIGQSVKVYSNEKREYKNDEQTAFSGQFMAKVALEALHGGRAKQKIAAKHRVHPNHVSRGKKQAVVGLSGVFSGGASTQGPSESEIKNVHAKIGRLVLLGV